MFATVRLVRDVRAHAERVHAHGLLYGRPRTKVLSSFRAATTTVRSPLRPDPMADAQPDATVAAGHHGRLATQIEHAGHPLSEGLAVCLCGQAYALERRGPFGLNLSQYGVRRGRKSDAGLPLSGDARRGPYSDMPGRTRNVSGMYLMHTASSAPVVRAAELFSLQP